MKTRTHTLVVGSQAPPFSLDSANGFGRLSLLELIRRGPLILEFLRGTW